jgi:hypothetical protein
MEVVHMVPMGGKLWPAAVPILTPAQLPDGSVVNLLARAEGLVVYVAAVYPAPDEAPRLSFGRAQANALSPVTSGQKRASSSP